MPLAAVALNVLLAACGATRLTSGYS